MFKSISIILRKKTCQCFTGLCLIKLEFGKINTLYQLFSDVCKLHVVYQCFQKATKELPVKCRSRQIAKLSSIFRPVNFVESGRSQRLTGDYPDHE